MRRLENGGENIAKLIEYAVEHLLPNGLIPETALVEILTDYLDKPEFKQIYRKLSLSNIGDALSVSAEYQLSRDIDALWKVVPKAPPT